MSDGVRAADLRNPGSVDQDPFWPQFKIPAHEVGYPGGIFDPLGMAKGPQLAELKVKEIKNARLAMVAFVGFIAQSQYQGMNPLACLSKHLVCSVLGGAACPCARARAEAMFVAHALAG